MKAFIHIFRETEEIMVKDMNPAHVKLLQESIDDYMYRHKYSPIIYLQRYNDPVAVGLSEEFLIENKYHKITVTPTGFSANMYVIFEAINEDNSVCSCYDVYCDHTCGTLHCGCIDICRCRSGRDY